MIRKPPYHRNRAFWFTLTKQFSNVYFISHFDNENRHLHPEPRFFVPLPLMDMRVRYWNLFQYLFWSFRVQARHLSFQAVNYLHG